MIDPIFRSTDSQQAINTKGNIMSNLPVAHTKTFEFGDKTVVLETGRIARQADGAVLATIGDTQVLATVVAARSVKEGQDFFPLSDRKSTRLNSSHVRISYAVFCLKK